MNNLYYGDNLNILKRFIGTESVDLVYLDPPASANRNYNVFFKDESGLEANSREWLSAIHGIGRCGLDLRRPHPATGDKVSEMLQVFHSFVGENQMMSYRVITAVRLNLDSIKATARSRRFIFCFFAQVREVLSFQIFGCLSGVIQDKTKCVYYLERFGIIIS